MQEPWRHACLKFIFLHVLKLIIMVAAEAIYYGRSDLFGNNNKNRLF